MYYVSAHYLFYYLLDNLQHYTAFCITVYSAEPVSVAADLSRLISATNAFQVDTKCTST